jgi:hypothetical protein
MTDEPRDDDQAASQRIRRTLAAGRLALDECAKDLDDDPYIVGEMVHGWCGGTFSLEMYFASNVTRMLGSTRHCHPLEFAHPCQPTTTTLHHEDRFIGTNRARHVLTVARPNASTSATATPACPKMAG